MIELKKGGVKLKKYFFVVFCVALLFVVAGCTKKNQVVCTETQTENGVTIKGEIIVDFDKDDKLSDATAVYDLSDKSAADQYCSLFKLMENAEKGVKIECSGTKVTIKGFAKAESNDEEDEEMIGMTKADFLKKMESQEMTCK